MAARAGTHRGAATSNCGAGSEQKPRGGMGPGGGHLWRAAVATDFECEVGYCCSITRCYHLNLEKEYLEGPDFTDGCDFSGNRFRDISLTTFNLNEQQQQQQLFLNVQELNLDATLLSWEAVSSLNSSYISSP